MLRHEASQKSQDIPAPRRKPKIYQGKEALDASFRNLFVFKEIRWMIWLYSCYKVWLSKLKIAARRPDILNVIFRDFFRPSR
jgi:hypothetical protein